MANDKERENLTKKIAELEAQINKYVKEGATDAAKRTEQARSLTEELKDQLGIQTKINEGEKTLLGISQQIAKSAQENAVELGKSGKIDDAIKKDKKIIADALREQLIIQKSLTETQKKDAELIFETNKNRLDTLSEIDKLTNLIGEASESEIAALNEQLKIQYDLLAVSEDDLGTLLELVDADTQRYVLSSQLLEQAQENLKAKEKEKETQNEINSSLGIAGGIVKGLGALLGDFGKSLKLDEVADEMEKFAEEAARSGKEVSKLEVLGVGARKAFSNLLGSLTDPTAVITATIKGFNEIDKAQKDFRSQTGQNIEFVDTLNDSFLSTADYIKAASELTKELGVNAAAAFSPADITEVGELTTGMGLAAKEAANLAKLSKASGTNLADNTKAIESSFKSFVTTNRTALSFGDIMKDVGNVSASVSLSLGSNPAKIAEAAMQAKKFGLSLEQADKIASSLLDFESSISAELEAELLTGKDLNLEKARSAALSNDLATVAEEIGKNAEVNAAFSNGNRIQQEAIAKAMGMSRDDMAKMIYQQKINSGLTAEQAAKAADINLEEAKRLTAQEQMGKAMDKLTQAFAPIVEILASVAAFIADILSRWYILYPLIGLVALSYFPKIVSGVKSMTEGLKDSIKSALDLGKNLLSGGEDIEDQLLGGEGDDKVVDVASKSDDKAGELGKKSKSVSGQAGKGVKEFLTNLSKGIQSFSKVTLGDIGKLALSGLALVALTPAIPALLLLQFVSGPKVKSALKGIADGLVAFGKASKSLTEVAPYILLGEALLAGFGAALIPLTYALSLLSPLLESFGKVIKNVLDGVAVIITAVADGFVKLLDSITIDKVAAVGLLGGALISLGAGLITFAGGLAVASAVMAVGGLLGNPLDVILEMASKSKAIKTTADSLTQMVTALTGVASALNDIDTDKLEALGDFATENAFANAASGIVSAITAPITAIGNKVGGGGADQQAAKLDEIKAILQQILTKEGTVNLDSQKIGQITSLKTVKVQ
jgi:hypothetical protein